MENIVEINVDLLDKYDLVEKYNKSVVSRNLIDYIIEQAMEYKPSSDFKIIVSKKAQIDHDSTKLIREGLTKEFEKAKTFHRNENYKQILYLVIGILLIFLATRFSNPIVIEILSVSAWVPLWEAVDLALFSEADEVAQITMLRNLINGEITER